MDWYSLLMLLFAFLLVLANGFFVAAEFALVKVRATRLEELANQGNRRAKSSLHLVKHLDEYLGATQLGITLASLALGWVGEPAFASLLEKPLAAIGLGGATGEHAAHGAASVIIAFSIITFLHIVVGELAPKSIAIQRAEGTVLAVSGTMKTFYVVVRPMLWALNKASGVVLRVAGLRTDMSEHDSALGPDELKIVVETSHRSGLLPDRTKSLLERTFSFSRRTARELMVPRGDTVFLSTDLSFEENLARAGESVFSRYPLCEDGNQDNIIGLVYARDLLLASMQGKHDIRALAKEGLFVPSIQSADELLQLFRRKKIHLAIVVDEYGGTLGVVSLEDVLEVLVGEIQDETDTETAPWQKQADGSILIDGGVPASEAAERLNLKLEDESSATLGGVLITALGHVPKVGEVVPIDSYNFEITEMKKMRILRVRASQRKETSVSAETAEKT